MQLGMCCCPGSSSSGSSVSGSGSISNFITTSSACSTCSSNVTPVRYKLTVNKDSGNFPAALACYSAYLGEFYLTYLGGLTWFDNGQQRVRCTWRSTNTAKQVYSGSSCADSTVSGLNNSGKWMWAFYHAEGFIVSGVHRNIVLNMYAQTSSGGTLDVVNAIPMSQPNTAAPGSLTRNCLSAFSITRTFGVTPNDYTLNFSIEPW